MRDMHTINDVNFVLTHAGQKKAYGDSIYEYHISSDRPASEVEKVCREDIRNAIPHAEWQADYRQPGCSMEKAFRPYYEFRPLGDGKYRYVVTMLYTD
jgi:hypothetical protein